MKRYIGILIAFCVLLIQLVLIPRVGMGWDEPSSFFVGRANLKFWMTGNRAYLNDLTNKELFKGEPIQYIYGEDIYPPLPFVISSFVSHVLSDSWHVMNTFDAYHLGEVLIGSFGVWGMYGLAIEAGLTIPVAIITTLAYALYPTIWGAMRNDAKDVPLVSMLTATAYLFLLWIKSIGKKTVVIQMLYGIGFSVLLGLSGATKPTAAIFAVIAAIWISLSYLISPGFRKKIQPLGPFLFLSLVMTLVSLGAFLIAWPWLWESPISKILQIFSFFKTVGYNMPTPFFGTIYHAAVNLPRTYAITILAIQTPIEITLLAVIGLIWATHEYLREHKVIPGFFVLWFVIGMGRFFIPGVIIYSWVRHFIDAMPAFFILAGYGILWLSNKIPGILSNASQDSGNRVKQVILYVIGGFIVLHQIIISIQLFPYEMSYFNIFVGGTKRVAQKWYFDVGQGAGVKEAMEFIEKDSKGKKVYVYPCLMGHIARFYATANTPITSATEYGNYMIVPNSPSWFEGALSFAKDYQDKVYTISRGGAELFYVYKYRSSLGWRCGWETKSNYEW